jgi:hypothetical protein
MDGKRLIEKIRLRNILSFGDKGKEVEKIPKKDAIDGLKNATKDTRNGKGGYGKGKDSGKILGEIRPQKVSQAAPHCRKLFEMISEAIG